MCVPASTVAAAANSITFKLMLNAYKSSDPKHPHDCESLARRTSCPVQPSLCLTDRLTGWLTG